MRSSFLRALAAVALLAGAAAAETAAPPSVEQLAWLSGCWGYVEAEAGSGETWMPPAGGMLVGVSRTVRAGLPTRFEYMRIGLSEAGALEYVAQPAGGAEARFALVSLSANEAVFENPLHDFPQRVIYRLAQNGRLAARIEGKQDGEPRAVDFPMRRVSCDASPPAHRR